MNKQKIIAVLLAFITTCSFATTWTVTNKNDNGAGSLRASIANAAKGDTVRFDSNLLNGANDTIKLDSQIVFNHALVIKGLYTSTDTLFISGQDSTRIFEINEPSSQTQHLNVVLDSLVLVKGNGTGTTSNEFGGAIFYANSKDTLCILNSVLKHNNAKRGGCIYVQTNNKLAFKVENSKFLSNKSGTHGIGPGIYLYGESNCQLYAKLSNSEMSKNTYSTGYGGALTIETKYQETLASAKVILDNMKFESNNQGVIFFRSYNIDCEIKNSIFTGNGGNHTAALAIEEWEEKNKSELRITNSKFLGSIAATAVSPKYMKLYMDSALFANNGGRALWQDKGESVIRNSEFTNNNKSSSSNNGGAITTGTKTKIYNSTFSGNIGSTGGSIYASESAADTLLYIQNCTFTNNEAVSSSSNIHIYGSGAITKNFIVNSTIYGNKLSQISGGIVQQEPSNAAIEYSGMHLSSTLTIKGSIFAENGTGKSGINGFTYFDNNTRTITSAGYNIIQDFPTNLDSSTTDIIRVSADSLNLSALRYNGGFTRTLGPLPGSIAINKGDPSDNSNAQNKAINGIRDIGAAEACSASSSSFSVSAKECVGYTLPSGNKTYLVKGSYVVNDTIQNVYGCDSIMTISITIDPLTDQAVTAQQNSVCKGGSNSVGLTSSSTGVLYSLRNDANDTIVGTPQWGSGGALSFPVDSLNENITYNVYAEANNGAIELDGVNDYIKTGIDITPDSIPNFTFEAWVYPTRVNHAGRQALFSQDNCCYDRGLIIENTTSKWAVSIGSGVWLVDDVDLNQWQHVAVVYDNANKKARFFKNGVEFGSGTTTAFDAGSTKNMTIGKNPTYGENFKGIVDEVKIWSTARSASEILSLKDSCLTGKESGLLSYYKLNEGHDTTVVDLKGNNNGSLYGTSASARVKGYELCTMCTREMSAKATIQVTTVDTSVVQNNEELVANATSAAFQWLDCNNSNAPINGATANKFKASSIGKYSVEVTTDGCKDTSACIDIPIITSVIEGRLEVQVSIYPNPANDVVNIDLGTVQNAQITVLNNLGEVVAKLENVNERIASLSLEALTPGVYFVRINAPDLQTITKVIKK